MSTDPDPVGRYDHQPASPWRDWQLIRIDRARGKAEVAKIRETLQAARRPLPEKHQREDHAVAS